MGAKRALIVGEQPVVREGLRRVLEADKDIEVVGEAASAEEALAQAQLLSPDFTFIQGMRLIEASPQVQEGSSVLLNDYGSLTSLETIFRNSLS